MANVSKMSFPLLRLPILAIFEVLATMNPLEIFNFSMSSLRCKKIVKLFFRSKSKFQFLLYIVDKPCITLKGTQHYWDFEFTSEQKDDNILKYNAETNTDTLMKYSINVVESFFNFIKYIDDLMNPQKIELFLLEMFHFPLQNELIIQGIRSIEKPITWLNLHSEENFGNDAISILSHVEGVKFLNLTVPKDFEMNIPYSLCYMCVEDGQWIKLNHILGFNSSKIEIRNSKLSALELCDFFQSWISSESQLNLKKLEIDIEKREVFENISQNLPQEENDDNVDRRVPNISSWQNLLEWFNIKRNDGTIASILLSCSNTNPDHLLLGMIVR